MSESQSPFHLPGAERFARYLNERVGEGLRAEERSTSSRDGTVEELYRVYSSTEGFLGEYKRHRVYERRGEKNGKVLLGKILSDICVYEGRIPGHRGVLGEHVTLQLGPCLRREDGNTAIPFP